MKLYELHNSEIPNISWIYPNLEREWEVAQRYPKIFQTKKEYLKIARDGEIITIHPNINLVIKNFSVKDKFSKSVPEKKKRVEGDYGKRTVEMPILIDMLDGTYELMAGKARMTYATENGLPVQALVIKGKKKESPTKKDKKTK
ncbi:MAG TPA: hypothetical protein VJ201_08955 [Candidatus Babeliales bacterium]|nr:hypothetical protein [Candidatus Babeliales bacterium]